ncbi:MAG: undecaprenyl/decaprenyl-phosphate alpha-N-acetylglucosaminyl 1-phosphate transferase [Clostridiales bacterium]|nr:undecaprenyl/decaprenyl-phosphate alpha-N-acetylglucosaminyl 1-phosphate transferase [Clostridiales bacterium]
MDYLMVFLAALILTLIFTPVAIFIAPKIGAVDIPKDNRRMHTKPMPRFGGIAIFIGTMSSIAIFLVPQDPQMVGVLVGGALIYILGLIDDLKGLPAKVKFLGQIAIACVVFAFGIRIDFISNFFAIDLGYTFFPGVVAFLITIIWIVGITNTINLIDGLDGLAAGVTMIASFSIAYAGYISWTLEGPSVATLSMLALAGGALGFLPYNFNPAKIFMGDSGSLFLGFMLAVLSIEGATKSATVVASIAPMLVLGVPVFDTAFAIFRRLINKRPIMEADKGHLHHRIMAVGFGQRRAVLMLYGISATMGVAAVLLTRDLFMESIALLAIAGMLIYIFLTDAGSMKLNLKAVNIAQEEKKKRDLKD